MKKLIVSLGWAIQTSLWFLLPLLGGALMATSGIRYYQGDPELARWVTSLGPGEWFAGPFIIIGFLLMGGPLGTILRVIFDDSFKFDNLVHRRSEKITLLAVYILIMAITAWLIKVFDLRAFQLFWSR